MHRFRCTKSRDYNSITVQYIHTVRKNGRARFRTCAMMIFLYTMRLRTAERTDLCSCRDDTESENRTGTRGADRPTAAATVVVVRPPRPHHHHHHHLSLALSLSHCRLLFGRMHTEHRLAFLLARSLSLAPALAHVHSLRVHK